MTLDQQDQWHAELRRNVVTAMQRVAFDLYRQGIRTDLLGPEGTLPVVSLTVFEVGSDVFGPNFTVQREEPQGWGVYTLTFTPGDEGLVQHESGPRLFEHLPNAAWFERELRAFVKRERAKGYLGGSR